MRELLERLASISEQKEGEHEGRKVKLDDPFRLPSGSKKKFGVYVRDPDTGNVIKVTFGDPNMEIKRDDPERRKSFRARHKCSEQKDKTTAAYWSCYQWREGSKVDEEKMMSELIERIRIPKEIREHYYKRTKNHIGLVEKYGLILSRGVDDLSMVKDLTGMDDRLQHHDESKFLEPELTPYVWLTWRYKCKDDGVECNLPDGMEERIEKATEHHILSNTHHPECSSGQTKDLLNKEDRDKPPKKMIDATKMSDLDIAEMVADWCAMGEERGNTPREWADKNVNIRWKFSDNQRDMIYEMIDYAWKKGNKNE